MCGQEYEMEDSVFVQKLVESGTLQKVEENWKPREGESWYFLSRGTSPTIIGEVYGELPTQLIKENNYWKTKEEAEYAAKLTKNLWLALHENNLEDF